MGFAIHHKRRRDVDSERHLRRLHKTTVWIQSPLTGADHEHLVFSQRNDSNSVELFFDLFFVANLATFTTYHTVTDLDYLGAYVGFFSILWSFWFQVTLHDVRFARDSIFERSCKVIQFIVFVGLALVGSAFNPAGASGSNANYRILCYTLVLSRILLSVQYAVVLFYTYRERYTKLYLPLGLITALYALGAGVFGALTPAFRAEDTSHRRAHIVWYVMMVLEAIGVVAISCCWRMLSFKKTHLMERMSLLTLIVIGEGAIGVTKTVSRMMGKSGLDLEGCFLIMCIITTLVLLFAIYFDNFPHGHYGTIRQQIWSLLHFPFQLAVVGIVEGSQQLALARYVIRNYNKIDNAVEEYCLKEHLDGAELRDKFIDLLNYWQFQKKFETYAHHDFVASTIYAVGNTSGICSPSNTENLTESREYPPQIYNVTMSLFDGVYQGLGIKLSTDKLEDHSATEIAMSSWKTAYMYYWFCFVMLIASSMAFLILIRRHKIDLFDYLSVTSRVIALGIGGSLLALIAKDDALYTFIGSPGVLPSCLSLLLIILLIDKISAVVCNWQLDKSGELYAVEYDDDPLNPDSRGHSRAGSRTTSRAVSRAGSRASSLHREPLSALDQQKSLGWTSGWSMEPDRRKSIAWSMYSDTEPVGVGNISTTAVSPQQSVPMLAITPQIQNPAASPAVTAPITAPNPSPAPSIYPNSIYPSSIYPNSIYPNPSSLQPITRSTTPVGYPPGYQPNDDRPSSSAGQNSSNSGSYAPIPSVQWDT